MLPATGRPQIFLQACLNGGRQKAEHPGVPVTPAELARDARTVRAAGAVALHLHPRDRHGRESLHRDDVASALAAVRAAVPGMPVGIGTGAWISPGGRLRHEFMRDWNILPDYASVNLGEEDAPKVMGLLQEKGIGIEAGLLCLADAERFLEFDIAHSVLRILVEMPMNDGEEAIKTCRDILAMLADAGISRPVLVHGEGGSVWPMMHFAATRGLAARAGFEDSLWLADGRLARDNAQIIEAACRILSS
ncbi:MAG: 3-keto-5-aminohexanoate cleavage protein [Geminicoccaceae bacterium]